MRVFNNNIESRVILNMSLFLRFLQSTPCTFLSTLASFHLPIALLIVPTLTHISRKFDRHPTEACLKTEKWYRTICLSSCCQPRMPTLTQHTTTRLSEWNEQRGSRLEAYNILLYIHWTYKVFKRQSIWTKTVELCLL